MPNNLVFNTDASELSTQIYGLDGSTVRPIAVDSNGNLVISGTITSTLDTVTAVVAGTVTVSGTVTATLGTVTAVVDSGTVTALFGTVTAVVDSGTITALFGTVTAVVDSGTVTALFGTVTAVIASGTITAITEVGFFETNTAVSLTSAATLTAMTQNTSPYRTLSFYVKNTSAVTMNAILQDSPVNTEGFYVDDGTATAIAPGTQKIMVPIKFMKYTRVLLGSTTDVATADIYYNAQT